MSLVLLALSFSAFAEEKKEEKFPVVKPSGVIYPRWSLDLSDGADGYNEFAVDRVYLRTDVTIAPHWAARVTLDADHMKPAELASGEEVTYDTKYRVFVKHAYLEAKDLGPLKVRAGMIDTPYTPYYDNFWGNRYIAESFAKNVKVLETADLGVAVLGKHAGGLVDWNVSLVNGEGYGKVELDSGKAVQARLTVDPLAKPENQELPITGFVSFSDNPSADTATLVYAGAVGFQIPRLCAWAEVLGTNVTTGATSTSGLGYSATVNPRLPKIAGIVARYDHWDPDTSAGKDETTLVIAGVEKDFLEKVAVAVTYERSWADALPNDAAQAVVVHAQAGF